MNKLRVGLFAICCIFVGVLSAAFGQSGSNYEISNPKHQYAITVSSLRGLDFQNFTVFWYRNGKREPSAHLENGSFTRRDEPVGGEYVTLDLVKVLEGGRYAIIDVSWSSCGGSCSESGLVQVLELQSGHPTVVEQITYGRHAAGSGASFDGASRILTVTGRSSEPSPNCCPKSLDVMTFEWDGKTLVFKAGRRDALPEP
jgi:hypothetical protein